MAAKNYLLNFDGYWRDVNKDSLPAQSGIYAVYAATYDGIGKTVSLRRLLYIGESADVRSRVATHERRPDWLKKLSHPVRSGEHSNTAFALGLMLDHARSIGNREFEQLLEAKVREWIKTSWPFSKVAFPGLDVSISAWNALPDAGR